MTPDKSFHYDDCNAFEAFECNCTAMDDAEQLKEENARLKAELETWQQRATDWRQAHAELAGQPTTRQLREEIEGLKAELAAAESYEEKHRTCVQKLETQLSSAREALRQTCSAIEWVVARNGYSITDLWLSQTRIKLEQWKAVGAPRE